MGMENPKESVFRNSKKKHPKSRYDALSESFFKVVLIRHHRYINKIFNFARQRTCHFATLCASENFHGWTGPGDLPVGETPWSRRCWGGGTMPHHEKVPLRGQVPGGYMRHWAVQRCCGTWEPRLPAVVGGYWTCGCGATGVCDLGSMALSRAVRNRNQYQNPSGIFLSLWTNIPIPIIFDKIQ